ncbi:MAG: VapC toxin family PIN domain ribonuclease [Verrucomicrobiota bacterium]|nr:VapC toxin family PIN domain ribonuclease [Verrucomicrobiota bacterium]
MHLLDVNTLMALAWDDSHHYQSAHSWFAKNAPSGFATCHVTQSGFLRLSLNPKIVNCQLTSAKAIEKLKTFVEHPKHQFWEDGPVNVGSTIWQSVTGYGQVTDLNLFLIARRHAGKLVTFDGKIRNWLSPDEQQWLEIIPQT